MLRCETKDRKSKEITKVETQKNATTLRQKQQRTRNLPADQRTTATNTQTESGANNTLWDRTSPKVMAKTTDTPTEIETTHSEKATQRAAAQTTATLRTKAHLSLESRINKVHERHATDNTFWTALKQTKKDRILRIMATR